MRRIAGVDEVGRGPLAGPVVAAAVVFPEGYTNKDFVDSKQLSRKRREYLVELVRQEALETAVVAVGHRRIARLNIRNATKLAMSLAVARVQADEVRIDGNMLIDTLLPQQAIVGGDRSEVAISAASIIAKVYRDHLMDEFHRRFPGYGFDQHAGYGTEYHRQQIVELGPCPIHRTTFRGVKEHLPPPTVVLD